MARIISRKEAAKLLDVNDQTITNWVNKGILIGHKVDGYLKVDKSSIDRYFDSLKDIALMGEHIRQMQESLSAKERELKASLDDACCAQELIGVGIPKYIFTPILEAVLGVAGEDVLTYREHIILVRLIEGKPLDVLGQEFGISRTRVIQVVSRSLRKFFRMKSFSELRQENRILVKENESCHKVISSLQKSKRELEESLSLTSAVLSDYDDSSGHESGYISELLGTDICHFNLTTRSLNCLKAADIDTLGDLVSHDKSDLMRFRNFGKKSLSELQSIIEGFGLRWGMDVDSIIAVDLHRKREKEKSNH